MSSLTFAIPYYSGPHYLARAIESVLRQQDSRWKLCVCDGSRGDAEAESVSKSFGDSRIRYLPSVGRASMVQNWNRCLELADTDLVTLLHGDDELLDGYCGLMLQAAAEHPGVAAFFCPARIIDERGRERFSFPDYVKTWLIPSQKRPVELHGEPGLAALLRGNFIMCPTLCYWKSILAGRRFAERWSMVPDLNLTTQLLLEGESLLGLTATQYAYRRHAGNATVQHTDSLLRFHEEIALYDELASAAADRGWDRASTLASTKAIVKLNLAYCALGDASRLRVSAFGRKFALLRRLLSTAHDRTGETVRRCPALPPNASFEENWPDS